MEVNIKESEFIYLLHCVMLAGSVVYYNDSESTPKIYDKILTKLIYQYVSMTRGKAIEDVDEDDYSEICNMLDYEVSRFEDKFKYDIIYEFKHGYLPL